MKLWLYIALSLTVSLTFEEANILVTPGSKMCYFPYESVTHKLCTLSEHHLPIHTLLITQ